MRPMMHVWRFGRTAEAGSYSMTVADETGGSGSGGRRPALIFTLGALSALGPISIDLYLPALPAMAADLETRPSLVQLTLTACVVGLALGQAVVGPLSDIRGRRGPLLTALVTYALTSLLCAAAPSIEFLLGFRLLQGIAGGAAIVIARSVVRDLFEGVAVARFFSTLMLVSGVAPIVAPLLGGVLLKVTAWPGLFGFIAVLGAVFFAAVLWRLPESLPPGRRSGQARTAGTAFVRLATDRIFMGYALSGGLAFAAMFAYIAGSPFVIQTIYGLSPLGFSLIFAANGLGIVVAGRISSKLAGRITPRRLLAAGLSMSLLGAVTVLAAVTTGLGLWGLLPGLFLVVSAIGLILPNTAALALTGHPPNEAGSGSALLGLTQFVVGGIAAPLVGIAGSHTAVPMGIVIFATAAAAPLAFLLTTARGDTGDPPGDRLRRMDQR